eukprot:m.102028 g.102028  ORF g.102028 m.102028 type:complete len:56 (+) comp14998_c0_seq1:674-841(+)
MLKEQGSEGVPSPRVDVGDNMTWDTGSEGLSRSRRIEWIFKPELSRVIIALSHLI